MSPGAHLLAGWILANGTGPFTRRDYWLVTGAGLLPDLDGFGYPVELLTAGSAEPLLWYSRFHHVLLHGCVGLALVLAVAWAWSRRLRVAALAAASFLLHLGMDLAGSGGPDGGLWTLLPWWPVSDAAYAPAWQWPLNSEWNLLCALVLIAATIVLAVRRRFTPFRLFTDRVDAHLFRPR